MFLDLFSVTGKSKIFRTPKVVTLPGQHREDKNLLEIGNQNKEYKSKKNNQEGNTKKKQQKQFN